jgi:hypothetical protein
MKSSVKKKIFLALIVLFILTMLLLAYDMMSRTTPPWMRNKNKQSSFLMEPKENKCFTIR